MTISSRPSCKDAFWWIPLIGSVIFAALCRLFTVYPIMPIQASLEAVAIDRAFQHCLILTIFLFSLVMATLIYMLIRFRAKSPTDEGVAIHHSRSWWLESSWVAVSLALTVGLAVMGWRELSNVYGSPQADLDVEVRAEQFSWEFFYPKFNLTGSRLFLPIGKRARISLTSKDVIHSFWVPEFRLKQDAVPGKVTTLLFTPTKEGEYLLMCNQLCGRDHTSMTGFVQVVSEAEFAKQFSSQGGEAW